MVASRIDQQFSFTILISFRSLLCCCSIRTSFSAVRTIANMLREEKGRVEDALLALDMRLPLLQNLTSTSQACSTRCSFHVFIFSSAAENAFLCIDIYGSAKS